MTPAALPPGYDLGSFIALDLQERGRRQVPRRTHGRRFSAPGCRALSRVTCPHHFVIINEVEKAAGDTFLLSLLRWNGCVGGRRFLLRARAACHGPGSWHRHT